MNPEDFKLCWMDLETTGLHAGYDEILEVGVVLTRGPDLREVFRQSWVIKQVGPLTMDSYVLEMHAKNGLLLELQGGVELKLVEQEIVKALEMNGFVKPMLAGSSVGFDRSFIALGMPDLREALHYRNYDVRTLRTFYEAVVGMDVLPAAAEKKAAHRALQDLDEALDAARTIYSQVNEWFGKLNSPAPVMSLRPSPFAPRVDFTGGAGRSGF